MTFHRCVSRNAAATSRLMPDIRTCRGAHGPRPVVTDLKELPMKILVIVALATLAGGCHSLEHYVQPYGSDAYLIDDAEAVPLANKWCGRSGKVMQPVGQSG